MNDIEDLQEKVAYQEHTIEQLNDALSKQQQQISQLQEEVKILAQLLRQWRTESRESGDSNEAGIIHEIPPHY